MKEGKEMIICTKCGAQAPDGSSVCPNCGSALFEGQPNQQAQYQQPYGQYGAPGAGFRAPIQRREIVTCIILSIITCGIYGLYWFFCLVNDLNTAANSPDDTGAGMVLLLSIITCGIYGWIWLYKAGEKIDRIRVQNGESPASSAILYLLLSLFGLSIVVYCLIQNELNKVAAN